MDRRYSTMHLNVFSQRTFAMQSDAGDQSPPTLAEVQQALSRGETSDSSPDQVHADRCPELPAACPSNGSSDMYELPGRAPSQVAAAASQPNVGLPAGGVPTTADNQAKRPQADDMSVIPYLPFAKKKTVPNQHECFAFKQH